MEKIYIKEKNVNVYDIQSASLSVFLALANELPIFHQQRRGQSPENVKFMKITLVWPTIGTDLLLFSLRWFLMFSPALCFLGKIMPPSLKVIPISHFPIGSLNSGLGTTNPGLDQSGRDDWAAP